jgi:hypothetical protein
VNAHRLRRRVSQGSREDFSPQKRQDPQQDHPPIIIIIIVIIIIIIVVVNVIIVSIMRAFTAKGHPMTWCGHTRAWHGWRQATMTETDLRLLGRLQLIDPCSRPKGGGGGQST